MPSNCDKFSPDSPIIPDDVRKVYERTTDGVAVLDAGWICLYLNEQGARLWRCCPEDLVGKNFWEVYPEAVGQPFYQAYHTARHEQRVIHLEEYDALLERWIEVHVYPDPDGSTTLFFRDVTEQNRVQQALADERNLLRAIIDGIPDVVYAKDREHRFLVVNQAAVDLLGISSPEQAIGKTDFDFFPAPDAQRFWAEEEQLMQMGWLNLPDEVKGITPLGVTPETEHWFRGFKIPLYSQSGALIGLVGVARNVTEQHLVQEALRTSEERFRLLFEEAPLSLWEEDYSGIKRRLDRLRADGVDDLRSYLFTHPAEVAACLSALRVLNVNETSVRMYGAADKDDLIRNVHRIIPAEQQMSLIESYLRVAEGQSHFEQEVVDTTLTGEKLTLLMRWSRLPAVNEGEVRVLVALVDIGERQKMEEALRRQALLLDQISDAVVTADENFVIRSWNRAAETMYGWGAEEAIGKTTAEIFQTQFFTGTAKEKIDSLFALGHWEDEVVQRRKDGSPIPVLVSLTVIRDGAGNPVGTVRVNRDISALRRAETALRVAEQRYRYLFDNAPVMYLAMEIENGHSLIRDVNQAYLQTVGYSREEVVGRRSTDFLAPQPLLQETQNNHPHFIPGVALEDERVLRTRDGREIATLVRGVPDLDREGRVVGFLAMYTDITGLKETERQLENEARRVQTLLRIASRLNRQADLKSLMQAVCEEVSETISAPAVSLSLVDRERNLFVHGADVGLPPGYEKLTKPMAIPAHLMGDLNTVELIRINPIDTLTASPNYAMYVEQGLQIGVNVMLVRDGELLGSLNLHITDPERHFGADDLALLRGVADVVTQAILNAQLHEETLRHAVHLEDLVNERTMELEEALALAQEVDRLKTQFVSEINHELRTPLTNIIFYLDLLSTGRPEKRGQALAIIQREAEHLRRLIEDVLDLSHFDLGKAQMQPCPIDLNQVVQDVLAERHGALLQSDLSVTFHPWAGLLPVLADPDLIGRAAANLLDNALLYTEQGEVRIETRRTWADNTTWQTISITDTGPGIAPEDLPHLFERFYRGQSARQSGAPGTGLGLAISQEIVQRHNGRITVESEQGAGSTFTIWLPEREM